MSGIVAGRRKTRRKLQKYRSKLVLKNRNPRNKRIPSLTHILQAFDMPQISRCLHSENEVIGSLLIPRFASLFRGQSIEGLINFYRIELASVEP